MAAAGTLFGYGIRSAFPLERLSPAPSCRGTIEIEECPPVTLDGARITHRAAASGASFTIGRKGDGSLVIQCSVAGGFRLDSGGLQLDADRIRALGEIWEHRLVSVAIPLLLAERGDIVLHAAAIARDARTVAFVGASTRGKSTLAVAAATAGLDVLADDGVVLEPGDDEARVYPGPVGARVAAPGATRKSTRPLGGAPLSPARLTAIAILGARTDDALELERLTPTAAVPALLPSLIFAGSDRLPEAMRSSAWLAARLPVFRCRLPEGLDGLPVAVSEVVERLLSLDGA